MTDNKLTAFFDSRNAPRLIILLLLCVYAWTNFGHKNWRLDEGPQRGVIKWDVISYYSYLPAVFIYHDLSLDFTDEPGFDKNDNKFWYQNTEKGKKVIITSMGLSFLYSPFFFMAHALAPVFGEARDGFQSIYQFFLVFSALFYLGFGFFFLWKLLTRYFTTGVAATVLLLIGLGTNLYYYGTYEAAMTHAFSFSLIALFLHLTAGWYESPRWGRSVLVGIVYGLIVLIRPTNILLLILFLLWEVDSKSALLERLRFLLRKSPYILVIFIAFLVPWIPQLIYWKEVSGSFLYNSYSDVGSAFYFGNPHIKDFLFSYRKGWFVYTPLMLFGVLGFWPLYSQRKGLFFGSVLYLAVMIYVFSSWWSWWTGGSFGIRSMVDLMPVMAIPLAALVTSLYKQKAEFRNTVMAILVFFVFLNIFQSWQYQKVLIHWSGMTKKSYWTIFLSTEDRFGYWQNLTVPDAQLARKGIYVYYPAVGKDEKLLKMNTEEGKEYVGRRLEKERRLRKDIKRYARRNDTSVEATWDMVVDRAYEELTQ